MEQLLMKTRGIVNKNKQEKQPHHVFQQSRVFPKCEPQTGSSLFLEAIFK
jgi:hypothetical protein